MLTADGRTDARTDDGQKVIISAHPEHSSGELITVHPIGNGQVQRVVVESILHKLVNSGSGSNRTCILAFTLKQTWFFLCFNHYHSLGYFSR